MRVRKKERSSLGRDVWQRGGCDEADGGGRVNQREEEDGRRRHDSIRSSSVGSAKSFSHRSLAQRRARKTSPPIELIENRHLPHAVAEEKRQRWRTSLPAWRSGRTPARRPPSSAAGSSASVRPEASKRVFRSHAELHATLPPLLCTPRPTCPVHARRALSAALIPHLSL